MDQNVKFDVHKALRFLRSFCNNLMLVAVRNCGLKEHNITPVRECRWNSNIQSGSFNSCCCAANSGVRDGDLWNLLDKLRNFHFNFRILDKFTNYSMEIKITNCSDLEINKLSAFKVKLSVVATNQVSLLLQQK